MKTIFLTIFEGVEAKNLLRTSVVPTLLSDPEVRLVLLTKSAERATYYEAEFSNPRLLYEVVPRGAVRGFDRVFATLKFTLLRTATTELRRRMAYEARRNRLAYWSGWFINRLLARPLVRRLVRFLDYHLVRDATYAPLFDRYQPDLVFCAHLFDEPETHLVREAKRRGVKVVALVNSWDKVTARCIMRLLPEKAIVFNDIVKQEMMMHNEMRAENVFVAGIPQYDDYLSASVTSRETFFARIKADPVKPLLVYAPMGSTFSAYDWDIIDLLHQLNSEKRFAHEVELLVRFQPNDFVDQEALAARPWLRYDYPGIRFTASRGVDWDMNAEDLAHLHATLMHLSILVCYASSVAVDAACFDKPVVNINFKTRNEGLTAKSPTFFYETEHYAKALRTGGIRLVASEGALIEWVNRYLEDSSLDHEGRARLVAEQCQFTDGRAGERMGKFTLEQLSYGI
jgi:CDP-glycerol glycerophosphotransferase (TagB/SpsB family)